MPEPKKIDEIVLKPQAADLNPFKKQLATRFRHEMSVILGIIGEMIAIDHLESQGYKVCKVDDHGMMIFLYRAEPDFLKKQKPSLDRVSSRGYQIPTIDLHARWKGGYCSGFCEHIPTVLAVNIYKCYCRYRSRHHLQFPDLLGHKDGKHYVIEVKTNKGHVSPEQSEFMHLLERLGLGAMVIRVNLDSKLLTQDVF